MGSAVGVYLRVYYSAGLIRLLLGEYFVFHYGAPAVHRVSYLPVG